MQKQQDNHAPLAIITGAQQGIGAAVAQTFAATGHDVVIADISMNNSVARFKDHWACSGQLFCLQCDVSNEASVLQLFDTIESLDCAPPSILVNNAAPLNSGDQ